MLGRVEKLRLNGDDLQTDFVKGTETSIRIPGLLGFFFGECSERRRVPRSARAGQGTDSTFDGCSRAESALPRLHRSALRF